jgi:hypothetical protein
MKNLVSDQIENIDQLIDHLTRLASAYRKSYKFCGRINTVFGVTAGILSCSAALALVPAIPVFVSLVGAAPPVIAVITTKLKVGDKKAILKVYHQKIKQLITEAQIGKANNEEPSTVIQTIFTTILEMQKETNYTTPFEMYMKDFKLNGYRDAR